MAMPARQEMDEFANALQLSVSTKIGGVSPEGGEVLIVFEPQVRADDGHLAEFLKVFGPDGAWREDAKTFAVRNAANFNWPRLTLFLLLTRMDEENILKLAELDEFAGEIAAKLGLKAEDQSIDSVKKCAAAVSDRLAQKKMTIRELAEASGLTQVSISNFRSGKDIRLSNLLRIIGALGMQLKFK